MKEEVGSFTPEHEFEGPKRSRIRCILFCVTLITLVGLGIVLAIIFTQVSDAPSLIVHPKDLLVMESWKDREETREYMASLNAFADLYNGPAGEDLMSCSVGDDKGDGQCIFQMSWLQSPCSKDEEWGFRDFKPCLLLSFNEPRDWVPEPYTYPDELPEEMPKSLRKHIKNALKNGNSTKFLWVSCGGEYPADTEALGEPVLSPWPGFPSFYFPMRHDTSQEATPVLGLHIANAQSSVLISIVCHFWAKNLPIPYVAARIEYLMI
ncbi:sodium/potassium-transporting ATPase subunit beta-2-like isoform X2 [Eriocheir sinensis]|uniref:sodium/potassium-transporting ATPase subunit beta-2-like isoform X2 n=1 Tax=Eriocheir sinensis TaxID=95602 RepID=UPI0021C77C86|nr:sodium/potassium-transporting ATPase subunit beta-2-like isoform X2 [Eriocheir sinensis]